MILSGFNTRELKHQYLTKGNANDSALSGRVNGTVSGATLQNDRFGNSNGSYLTGRPSGTTQYINLSNSSSFDLNANSGTLAGWIYPISGSTTGGGFILNKGALGSYGSNIYRVLAYSQGFSNPSGTGAIIFSMYSSSGANAASRGSVTNTVIDSQWQHIVCVYDNNLSGNDKLKIYRNGVLASMNSIALGTFTTLGTNTETAKIGNTDSMVQPGRRLQNLKFFNKALSSSEVMQLYKEAI